MSTKETDEQQLRELLCDVVGLVTKYSNDGGDKVSMMHCAKHEWRFSTLLAGLGDRPLGVCHS